MVTNGYIVVNSMIIIFNGFLRTFPPTNRVKRLFRQVCFDDFKRTVFSACECTIAAYPNMLKKT